MKRRPTLHETLAPLIELKLKPFLGKDIKLTKEVCLQIYREMFQVFVDVISKTPVKLTNEAMNYIAQQYYDGIVVNGRHELDPTIFTTRATLDNIETKELGLIGMMLRGTDFIRPVVEALKRRGQA